MNGKIKFFLVIAFLISGSSFPEIYYVTKNGDDNSSGTSWQTAVKTISKAQSLAMGFSHDQIFVAEGVYQEGGMLYNYYNLYGGFEGTEADPSQRRILEHPTGIDGENKYTCVYNQMYIDGFHITNGKGTYFAGGIFNDGPHATVANCIIYGNSASYPELAGGIYNRGTGTVINCIVYNNQNTSYTCCGGISNDRGGNVIHCTVYNNQGGGIINVESVYNSIIWNNHPYDCLQFVWSTYDGTMSHSCYGEANSMNTNGNIRANPMFVNTSRDPSTWDFRLKMGSSCIDAGTLDQTWETDINGSPRPGKNGKVCMGAFESPDEFLTGDSHLPTRRLYVSKNGSNVDGTSWEDAFTSIAAALSQTEGDEICEIWVAKGTYKGHETLKVPGKINLYGGFTGIETHLEERHITQNATFIHGEESYECTQNNGYMDGFYLTKGNVDGGISNLGTVSNCILFENSSTYSGGGIYNCFGLVNNCILYKNSASSYGAGIHNFFGTVTNCILYSNSPDGIYSNGGKISNSISWANTTTDIDLYSGRIYYSCFREAPELSSYGNINFDPFFQNVDGDMSSWDFHLKQDSPCIDAGDLAEGYYEGCLPPGKGGLCNDMGAYGGPGNCNWGFYVGKKGLMDYLLGKQIMSSGHFPYADRNSDGIIDIGDLVDFIFSFPTPTPTPSGP